MSRCACSTVILLFTVIKDDYVLSKLLKSSGVHSALQHDQIFGDGASADIQLVEDEAEAVAKRAAEVLKRSRRYVRVE